jgi:hypothetical protein
MGIDHTTPAAAAARTCVASVTRLSDWMRRSDHPIHASSRNGRTGSSRGGRESWGGLEDPPKEFEMNRHRVRTAVAIIAAVLIADTATVEVQHRIRHGHWVAYGWHVDLATEKVTADGSGVERRWYAVVTSFSLLPGSVDACIIPNDVRPHRIPFYPFRVQVWNTSRGQWQTVRPELRLECKPEAVERQVIWPTRSIETEKINPAETGGIRERDFVRVVAYSTFDNRPGQRLLSTSRPFQFVYDWTGVVRTTLCQLAKDPERFSDHLVQFEATVEKNFERSVALDRTCGAEIWLDTDHLHDPLSWNGLYPAMNEHSCDPRCDVVASLAGKFQHDRSGGAPVNHGFGHLGQWSSQLVLKSVSIVTSKPTDASAPETATTNR